MFSIFGILESLAVAELYFDVALYLAELSLNRFVVVAFLRVKLADLVLDPKIATSAR